MKKVVVLGCGMVGSVIAADLSKNYEVLVADKNKKNLQKLSAKYSVKTFVADLSSKATITEITKNCDLVIGAVPGFMGFETVKTVIENHKNIVDISFFPEDAFQLGDLAKRNNVVAVVDAGVAPGMSNFILGYHYQQMQVEKFECFVGGLPFVRTLPLEYKAPFSPVDVLEEYTRPARLIENGKITVKPALSEPEFIEVENIGTLEAFNTDGLRSLLRTVKIPEMKEKTLRYPGHIEKIKLLRDLGFFKIDKLEINGKKIRPIDLTSRLLISQWKLQETEPEFTVMIIKISGMENGKPRKYVYHLFDRYDTKTGFSSMARTTGFACTSIAELVLNGDFTRKGISPPEFIGKRENCFFKVLDYQKQRNIIYQRNSE